MKKITFLMIGLMATFFASAQLNSVALVGGGTPGGWPTGAAGEVDAHQMTPGADNNWTYENIALNGAVKFRGNNSWASPYNWGVANPAGFPSGTAVVDSNDAITVPPGIYNVSFNSVTAAYTFSVSNAFPVVSLIGEAVGGWDPGDDVDMGTIDGVVYTKNMVTLAAGPVKWRQNHAWGTNWGPAAADINNLSGVAVLDSPESVNIANPGLYNATFNTTTLAYAFTNPKVAIVGNATPGGWPANTPGEIDPHAMATVDGVHYTLTNFTLVDGAAKFRRDNAWDSNWGANAWPTGTGTQNGADIPVTAGTYDIAFDASTGEYSFTTSTAGTNGFNAASLKVFPNPSHDNWNFTSANEMIESISIVDMLGKTVMFVSPKADDILVDASGFSNGIYLAKVATANGSATIRLVKN